VSEQFLNGTSAQCGLFSAIPLKVEKRYDIQSKCIKEKQMSYNTREQPIWNCTNEYLSKKKEYQITLSSMIWLCLNNASDYQTNGLYRTVG